MTRRETILRTLTSQLGESLLAMRRLLARDLLARKAPDHAMCTTQPMPRPRSADAASPAGIERKRTRQMRRDLVALLDRHPDSRRLMRQLHRVERALRTGGLAALEQMSGGVLAQALNQMERLVWDWSSPGLAELRSRIAVLVKTRPATLAGDSSSLPAEEDDGAEFDHSQVADISEVDHETFEEMERSWVGHIPQGAAAPAPASPTVTLMHLDV